MRQPGGAGHSLPAGARLSGARAEDWPHQKLASPFEEIAFPRQFSPAEKELIARGRVPRKKSEKWFAYQDDHLLNFHRAATGECVFQLDVGAGLARVAGLEGFSPDDRRAVLGYLIDRLLLGQTGAPPAITAFARLEPDRQELAWRNLVG